MFKRFSLIALAVTIVLSGALAVVAQDAQPVVVGPITQAILDRGEVICGVNTSLAGFATLNDAGEYEGFDVEFCRAVAAAVLGDANKVSYVPLNAQQRFTALQSGEIDVLSRNTTFTLILSLPTASTWFWIFRSTIRYAPFSSPPLVFT